VHWPQGFKAGGQIRTQFAHIIDIVPTVLDALSLQPPAAIRGVTQSPIHGVSFAHTLDDPAAATRHRTQYYEMFAHRAIDHDGWGRHRRAATRGRWLPLDACDTHYPRLDARPRPSP